MNARSLTALCLACSLVAPIAAQPAPGARTPGDELERAADLLAAGDSAAALELALIELERWPADPARAALAARALGATGARDRALAVALRALELPELEREVELELVEQVDSLSSNARLALVEEARIDALLALARECEDAELLLNAVDLLQRAGERGAARLERLHERRGMQERLAAAGLTRVARLEELPARGAARPWREADELRTRHFLIRTNLDPELARILGELVESLHADWHEALDLRPSRKRLELELYAERRQFEHYRGPFARDARAGLGAEQHIIAAWDPRSESDSIDELWQPLFRECARAFARGLGKDELPAWLDEALAGQLSQAEPLVDGELRHAVTGRPNSRELDTALAAGPELLADLLIQPPQRMLSPRKAALAHLLGEHLVELRDASGERVGLEALGRLLRGRRRERSVGVDELNAAIEAAGGAESTIVELHAALEERAAQSALVAGGGIDASRLLAERAQSARARGELDEADELLRAAIELAPTDPLAPYLLGDLLEQRGEDDEAFLRMRQAAEHLSNLNLVGRESLSYESGVDLVALLQERLQALDNGVARELASLRDELAQRAEESARSLLADGLPTAALYACRRAQRDYGASPSLTRFARELVDRHGADPRQWRRLDAGQHDDWLGGTRGWTRDDDSIRLSTEAAEILRHHYAQPEAYRLEVELDYLRGGEHPMAGLAFALDAEGRNIVLGILPHSGRAALLALGRSSEILHTFDTELELADGESAILALELGEGRARLELDGQLVAESELQDDWDLVRLALYGQSGEFAFKRLRILHE